MQLRRDVRESTVRKLLAMEQCGLTPDDIVGGYLENCFSELSNEPAVIDSLAQMRKRKCPPFSLDTWDVQFERMTGKKAHKPHFSGPTAL